MSEHFEGGYNAIEKKEEPATKVFVEVGTNQLPVTFMAKREFKDNEMYVGIDTDAEMVRFARHATREGQNATFIEARGEQLPLKNESVDEIFFGNVFGAPRIPEHKKAKFLDEAERVLKTGGSLVIKETNTPPDFAKLMKLFAGRNLHEERKLTPKDKEWIEELHKYENLGLITDDSSYLVFLKKIAAQ